MNTEKYSRNPKVSIRWSFIFSDSLLSVAGTDKAEMVERLVAGDPTIPAGLVSQDRAVLITDSI